jgi:hypothetical protein
MTRFHARNNVLGKREKLKDVMIKILQSSCFRKAKARECIAAIVDRPGLCRPKNLTRKS